MNIGSLLKRFFPGNEPGDPDAIGLLYQWYGRKIYVASYYILNDQYLAEDIAQETFITAMSKLDTLRDPAKVEAWLVRTAINKSYETLREKRRRMTLQATATAFYGDPVLDHLLDDELRREALNALRLLPAINQEVAYYKFYCELNCHEISEILEVPERTVRARLKRALELITQYLDTEVHETDVTGKETRRNYHRGCQI
jgi:RNA polymerase sigma-70 factor (ECF subfamily)